MLPEHAIPLRAAFLVFFLAFPLAVAAADRVRVGFVSTLSGAGGHLGADIRDGFRLALKHLSGRLGGLPAELLVADDQQDPERAREAAARFLERDKVDFMTGIVFSDIMLAVAPTVFSHRTFYISANAGPSRLAGEGCSPWFFNVAWQNDNLPEAMGRHVQDKGLRRLVILAPDYPGGMDAVAGFRRYYRGEVAAEIRPRLGQLDFGAEIQRLRSLKPEAVFFFLPGAMASSFLQQFSAAGLARDIQLFAPGFSADEDVIRNVGGAMLGIYNASHWGRDLDNPGNRRFVADFEQEYRRPPSLYAAQGYDAALLINAAVRDVKGRLSDREGLRRALEAKRFQSLRGDFRFGPNHFPIQDYYLRVVGKDGAGRVTNHILGTIFTGHADAYGAGCRM